MNLENIKKGYSDYCKSKSQKGYIWGSYASDVFEYLNSSEFKNLNLHFVSENMSIGDSFILQVKKPKCTVGQEYIVYKKIEQTGEKTEYWFLNDHDKPKTLYEGEYSR